MANPQGRVFPLVWDEYDYAPFFANLRKIGYDKRISVEASARDFPSEAPRAISLLRQAFDR
jgi:sugar phosphate isomerase/epimerase